MLSRIHILRSENEQNAFSKSNSYIKPLQWNLEYYQICCSTDKQLDNSLELLKSSQILNTYSLMPYAVISCRQRFAYGQNKRAWVSNAGGLWLSAAFPWPNHMYYGFLILAVVEGLSLQLENIGVPILFKWPNDLFVGRRKIAGILPRLLIRGKEGCIAKIGVGINISNKVPCTAINVSEVLNLSVIELDEMIVRVLNGFEWAIHYSNKHKYVKEAVERRLIGLNNPFPWKGSIWRIAGLDFNGGLVLRKNNQTDICNRYL